MARTPAARRRRGRRLTPRRWLPFLALTALVVGAAVIEPKAPTLAPAQVDATLDVTRVPLVTRTDAISTAWYCSGGSALGAKGMAELSFVLANDDTIGASAEVTLFGPSGELASRHLDVPANGRARLAASELGSGRWVGASVEVQGGRVAVDREVSGPLGFDAGPCTREAGGRWFVASGATVRGAQEYLSLFNPFPDATSVDIAFTTNTGQRTPRAYRGLSIAGRSVRVVKIGDTVTNRTAIAATVTARTGQLVVDRIQTYDGSGDRLTGTAKGVASTAPPKGLVSTLATPVRAPRWVFPGARVSEGIRTQIAVYNPGGEAAEVDVNLGYQDPRVNGTLEPVQLTVRPHEQIVVDLNSIQGIQPDVDLWVDVQSLQGVPVVAERLSFFGDPSTRQGAAVSLGSPVSARRWLVTQGGSTKQRSTTVQVANPGPGTAAIRVQVLAGGDRRLLRTAAIRLRAGDRRSLALDGAGAAASIVVIADRPVVVSSSIALASGTGIGVAPAFAYPESAVALTPVR